VAKKSKSGVILECYRRAAEARRMADAATKSVCEGGFPRKRTTLVVPGPQL
jgi:hypothetical protein